MNHFLVSQMTKAYIEITKNISTGTFNLCFLKMYCKVIAFWWSVSSAPRIGLVLQVNVHPHCFYIITSHIKCQSVPTMISQESKTIHIVEMTILFEYRHDISQELKAAKYQDLVDEAHTKGWIASLMPTEVGCRGFVALSAQVRSLPYHHKEGNKHHKCFSGVQLMMAVDEEKRKLEPNQSQARRRRSYIHSHPMEVCRFWLDLITGQHVSWPLP